MCPDAIWLTVAFRSFPSAGLNVFSGASTVSVSRALGERTSMRVPPVVDAQTWSGLNTGEDADQCQRCRQDKEVFGGFEKFEIHSGENTQKYGAALAITACRGQWIS